MQERTLRAGSWGGRLTARGRYVRKLIAPDPLPAEVQALIDWCDQPAPRNAADTRAVHFFLRNDADTDYQGFLFYFHTKPGAGKSAAHPPHFEGLGHAILTDAECIKLTHGRHPIAGWARIVIALTPALKVRLSFYDLGSYGSYPKKVASSYSTSDVKPGTNTWYLGEHKWYMDVRRSTVLLRPDSALPGPPT